MFRQRKRRQRLILTGIVLLATLAGAYLAESRFLATSLQAVVYDYLITAAPAQVKNQITVIAFDNETVNKRYGRWPVPRQAYVDLLTALKPYTPNVIAFDIGLYEASDKPEQDAALAAAIKDAGNVILAMQGLGAPDNVAGPPRFAAVQLPYEPFRSVAAGVAAVNVQPDPDARVREAQMLITGPDGTTYYTMPLVATARHLRADVKNIRIEGDQLILPARPIDRTMPIDEAGAMRIYFAAPPHPPVVAGSPGTCEPGERFYVVSMLDVIDGKVAKECLQFRSIYVGAHTLAAVPDTYPVPNSAADKMWGVEIWANAAQSIFTNRYPVQDQGFLLTLLQSVAITALGTVLVQRLRLWGFLLALVGLGAYSVIQLFLFIYQVGQPIGNGGVNVPSIGYFLPSIFWWVIVLGYLLVEERMAVGRTQSTFGRFVTPSVARTIMEREERGALSLGGEMREITVMFGDIRGFTTISEGMEPQILMGTLNRYFDGMVAIVNRYQGTVNKYNGDNIMVIWNAPVEVEDHARKAIECALEIQTWIVGERSKGGPDVSFGFGLNSGPAVAGFLGAQGRMEYTVIGDTVNVASRLTSNDIARRDQVACSKETLDRLGDDVVPVDLGAIFVKGRAEPVMCYQIDRIGQIANPAPAPAPDIPIGKAVVAGFH